MNGIILLSQSSHTITTTTISAALLAVCLLLYHLTAAVGKYSLSRALPTVHAVDTETNNTYSYTLGQKTDLKAENDY